MRSVLKIVLVILIALVLWGVADSQAEVSAQIRPVEVAFIGDYGFDNSFQLHVANLVKSWNPDFIVTVGDNRYGIDDFDIAVGKYYCDYLHRAQPGPNCPSGGNANRNRFFPTVGNHDYNDGNGIDDYLDYFRIPGRLSDSSNTSGSELYYDFTLGSVHFISLNSETYEDENSTQAEWAKAQLENSTAPFQIVLLHRAAFTSVERGNRGGHMRWPFEAWGADAVINGDDHFYERLNIGNIPYVTNGAGGRSLYRFGTIDAASVARYRDDFGALRLVATEDTLLFEYFTRDGTRRDTFTLPYKYETRCRTISLPAVEDTWIDAGAPDNNHGDSAELRFDGAPDHGVLIRWDFSAIPASATVTSTPIVTFDYLDGTTYEYEIHAMRQAWIAKYATWNHYDGLNAWPGGAGAIRDADMLIGATWGTSNLKHNIAFNEDGQALVQAWISQKADNNGVLVAEYGEASNGGDIYYRPHLTFDYCLAEATGVQLVSAETTPPSPNTQLLTLLLLLSSGTVSVRLHKRFSNR